MSRTQISKTYGSNPVEAWSFERTEAGSLTLSTWGRQFYTNQTKSMTEDEAWANLGRVMAEYVRDEVEKLRGTSDG